MLLHLPPEGPFLQEFYGERFKVMCYRDNPSGDPDLDLRNSGVREAFARRLAHTDFVATWSATPFCVEVRFNAAGFREREIGPKAAGVTRVGMIGDSFTYGHGLPEAASLPRQLERLLRAAPGAREFEVLNLGVGGMDLPQIADVGEHALRALDVDVLLYAYFINDGIRLEGLGPPSGVNSVMRTAWEHGVVAGGRLSLGARPGGFPRSVRMIARLLEQRMLARATLGYYRWLHNADNWPRIAAAFVRLQRVAAARGARFAAVPLPLPVRMGPGYPLADVQATVVNDLRARSIRVVDVLPALAAHGETELSLHPEDPHPNARYHRVAAQVLVVEVFTPR